MVVLLKNWLKFLGRKLVENPEANNEVAPPIKSICC